MRAERPARPVAPRRETHEPLAAASLAPRRRRDPPATRAAGAFRSVHGHGLRMRAAVWIRQKMVALRRAVTWNRNQSARFPVGR